MYAYLPSLLLSACVCESLLVCHNVYAIRKLLRFHIQEEIILEGTELNKKPLTFYQLSDEKIYMEKYIPSP